jgi:hypothetical protein
MTVFLDKGWSYDERDAVEKAFPVGCQVEIVVEMSAGSPGTRGRVLRHEHDGWKQGYWHIVVAWESGPYVGEDLGWIADSRFRRVDAAPVVAEAPKVESFCTCPNPMLVRNHAGGKWFEVCRRCKNERLP